jgi:hypothetical protein
LPNPISPVIKWSPTGLARGLLRRRTKPANKDLHHPPHAIFEYISSNLSR